MFSFLIILLILYFLTWLIVDVWHVSLFIYIIQKFACNGTVIEHPEYGEVIQLQGDQRKNICQFLTEVHAFSIYHTVHESKSLTQLSDEPCV